MSVVDYLLPSKKSENVTTANTKIIVRLFLFITPSIVHGRQNEKYDNLVLKCYEELEY